MVVMSTAMGGMSTFAAAIQAKTIGGGVCMIIPFSINIQ
eukprot:gene21400-28358_t